MIKLDFSQLQCPHPVVETRKQLLANPGASFTILVGDQTARENVTRLAEKMGYSVAAAEQAAGIELILASATAESAPNEQHESFPDTSSDTVVYCNSDQMGQGDEEFGQILLKNFFVTMLEQDPLPATILFVNSGVKLVCEDSEALEALNSLACRGVDIASCGLCLDYYKLKEKLSVGRVTNMFDIVETQMQARRIIRP